jgi:hypothetical protein
MLVLGLHPTNLGKDRQRDIHVLGREIDPHHFLGLQGEFRFDPDPQGADIDGLADFINGDVFPGKKPIALYLDDLIEGLPGCQALFIIRVHDKFPLWIAHRN